MDSAYVGGLVLSVAIFAPGVVVLAASCLIGLVMLLERSGALGRAPAPALATTEQAPGSLVSALQASLAAGAPVEERARKAS